MKTIEIIEKYIESDSQTRKQIELEVGQNQLTLSSLIGLMSECSTMAVRQNDKSFIEKGLYANVIEGRRQDFRDNIVQLTKLYHSSIILGLDPDKEFQKVADKSTGEGQKLITSFVQRKPEDKTLRCMGLKTNLKPQFDYVAIDWNDNDSMETDYSEPTDKKLMEANNNFMTKSKLTWLQKLFSTK